MTDKPKWVDELPKGGRADSDKLLKLLRENPGRWLISDKSYANAYTFAKQHGLECAMRHGITYLRAPEKDT